MPVKFEFSQLESKLTLAFRMLFNAIASAIQEQLELEERQYPNITFRQYGRGATGRVAGSPRDTIDSKYLYNSFQYKFLTQGLKVKGEYSYGAGYAALIYFGYLNSLGYVVPPYPWVEIALSKLDLDSMILEIWRSL